MTAKKRSAKRAKKASTPKRGSVKRLKAVKKTPKRIRRPVPGSQSLTSTSPAKAITAELKPSGYVCKYCDRKYENVEYSAGEVLRGVIFTAINVAKSGGINLLKNISDEYSKCSYCQNYHFVCPFCQENVASSPASAGEEVSCTKCKAKFVPII